MAEKCTNTSSPVERWMNPYPFAPLNHLTVPFSLTAKTPFTNREELFSGFLDIAPVDRSPLKEAGRTSVASLMYGRSTSKRKRLLSSRSQQICTAGNLGGRQFGSFPPHPTNVNPCSALITGVFSGNEQKIISSIKTFRKTISKES